MHQERLENPPHLLDGRGARSGDVEAGHAGSHLHLLYYLALHERHDGLPRGTLGPPDRLGPVLGGVRLGVLEHRSEEPSARGDAERHRCAHSRLHAISIARQRPKRL